MTARAIGAAGETTFGVDPQKRIDLSSILLPDFFWKHTCINSGSAGRYTLPMIESVENVGRPAQRSTANVLNVHGSEENTGNEEGKICVRGN